MISARRRDGRTVASKSKGAQNKKIDEVELGDLEGEEETPIKWRDYEIETLIAICGEMEEEFAKSARKQDMNLCIKNIDNFLINAKSQIQVGPIGPF